LRAIFQHMFHKKKKCFVSVNSFSTPSPKSDYILVYLMLQKPQNEGQNTELPLILNQGSSIVVRRQGRVGQKKILRLREVFIVHSINL